MARHPSAGAGPWPVRVLVAGVVAAVLLLACPAPAGAHGGAVLTIHGDGHGSVWVVAQYQDGHPITGPVGAVLTATSATGERVGPAPLRQLGNGTLEYRGTLSPGAWNVVAEMASPVLGRCTATVRVAGAGASATPEEVRCAAAAESGEPRSAARSSRNAALLWLGIGTVILMLAMAGIVISARRKVRVPVSGRKGRQ
jgi:hypothetical protein